MIRSRGLSFSYQNGRKVLSEIDFDIEKGESIAILGANGSGKSTLLRLIAALLPVREGILEVDGISGSSEKRRREIRSHIAYVFQNPDACFVSDIVLDDAEFTPLNYGYSEREAKTMAEDSLERFGILDKKDREIRTLSGGEKERAILSSLSSLEKDIYIFDEALTFLDESARDTLLSSILSLKKEGKTILFVTQNSDDALYFDKTMLLHEGRLISFDRTENVLRNIELLQASGIRLAKCSSIALELKEKGIELPYIPINREELCSVLGM